MSVMKAVRLHSYGDRSGLIYEDAPCPEARNGDLLIRVLAAGVNPVDAAMRQGYMAGWFPRTFPLILGLDVSGVVEAVGPDARGFRAGDEVFARTDPMRDGAYADFVCVPASDVVRKPSAVDHIAAAAVPHAGLTAWEALFEAGGLTEGETALIHGAAGGVGHLAVQFAKCRGARVIATGSGQRLDFLRGLGADEVIDYTTTPFEERAQDVDLVLDTVGGETQHRSWGTLKRGGILVSLMEQPSEDRMQAHGVRGQMVMGHNDPAILGQIAALMDEGQVKPYVSATFPLREAADAHEAIETRRTQGKIVLRVVE